MGIFKASAAKNQASRRGRAEMGLVLVGLVATSIPVAFASNRRRNMWKGSLTRIAREMPRSRAHSATETIEARVERPSGRTTTAVAGTPFVTRY